MSHKAMSIALMAEPPNPTTELLLYIAWNIFAQDAEIFVGSSPFSKGNKISSIIFPEGPLHPSPHPISPSSVVIFTKPMERLEIMSCDHPKGIDRGD